MLSELTQTEFEKCAAALVSAYPVCAGITVQLQETKNRNRFGSCQRIVRRSINGDEILTQPVYTITINEPLIAQYEGKTVIGTILHEFAHIAQIERGERRYGQMHNKEFCIILRNIFSKYCTQSSPVIIAGEIRIDVYRDLKRWGWGFLLFPEEVTTRVPMAASPVLITKVAKKIVTIKSFAAATEGESNG